MNRTPLVVGGVERSALRLSCGNDEAILLPDLGGRIAAWRTLGPRTQRDWLQPMPQDGPPDLAPRRGGCYPLVPYSNRVADGRFVWEGREHRLPPCPLTPPHALHGTGWMSPWTVEDADAASAVLEHRWSGGADWPWPFTARQTITLEADALRIGLSIRNDADAAQPVGLGLHPFFPDRAGARLTFGAESIWRRREDKIPVEAGPVPTSMDFRDGRVVPFGLDELFSGWTGRAHIDWPDGWLEIAADGGLSHAVLFAPEGLSFFCFEPVGHPTNAVNMARRPGLRTLEPGETLAATVLLKHGPA